ncbi:CpsD/CapB family tyrosine-protein kinase [candidate division KSB1 bacterium]|nr:CpsD/CapB family tyrosine-protein kinase [candidate division KSB1 bacterium]
MHNKTNSNGVYQYDENSPYFSDFYQLYSKLIARDFGDGKKVIMVTSATEGEGKTTVASYLAITSALASSDYFVLIDGDLRKPMLHKRFKLNRDGGLSDILMNKKRLTEVINKTPFRNLHLITAGRNDDKPFQLLRLNETKELLDRIRHYYKLILIDGPPIIPVSDSLRLAQIADGVIMVVKAGKTPRTVIKRAIQLLSESGCQMIGVVLNDTQKVLPYYYQHSYYRYEYSTTTHNRQRKESR